MRTTNEEIWVLYVKKADHHDQSPQTATTSGYIIEDFAYRLVYLSLELALRLQRWRNLHEEGRTGAYLGNPQA